VPPACGSPSATECDDGSFRRSQNLRGRALL
jgi:hypothetical protein